MDRSTVERFHLMKKLFGAFICVCAAMVLAIGTTGCTKTDKATKDKKTTDTSKKTEETKKTTTEDGKKTEETKKREETKSTDDAKKKTNDKKGSSLRILRDSIAAQSILNRSDLVITSRNR